MRLPPNSQPVNRMVRKGRYGVGQVEPAQLEGYDDDLDDLDDLDDDDSDLDDL